ncbi:MAG: ABC transporter substrate-binding protein [Patescibacteria group bacterium]|nr:ABC transporter substrate-binding protein [Patescibacteria group bacterium]
MKINFNFRSTIRRLFDIFLPWLKKIGLFLAKYLLILFKFLGVILKNIFAFLAKLYSYLNRWEKIALAILAIILFFSSSRLTWQKNIKNTVLVADFGGTYIEGLLVQKPSDAALTINKLTKSGLTRLDNSGNLQPDLAQSWEIKDDGKTYVFHLRELVGAQDIANTISAQKKDWQDIAVEVIDSKTLEFKLNQPYSPLLNKLAEPLFNYGPYILAKETKTEARLKARQDYYIKQPYIQELALKFYADTEAYNRALAQKEVDGISQVIEDNGRKGYNTYTLTLPKWQVLFFNLNKEQLQDKIIRQRLAKGEKLDKNLDLTLVTLDKDANIAKAQELKNAWKDLGVNLNIVTRDALTLQKEIIPKRDYDILLYGIDYGYDPDPYPFWHSSQISETGLNLSDFANIDADKILEEGRQTIDFNKRKELYANFQKILDEEVPAIFLSQDNWQFLVSNKVKGVSSHLGINPSDRYNEVWNWYVKEKRVKK